MKTSTKERKALISKAIREIVEKDRIFTYVEIAEQLNKRRVKMVVGAHWTEQSAREMARSTGASRYREMAMAEDKKRIVDRVFVLLKADPNRSYISMVDDLNSLGFRTTTGIKWGYHSFRSMVHSNNVFRKEIERANLVSHRNRDIRLLEIMIETGELAKDCIKRAKGTIENLKGSGVLRGITN